MKHTIGHFLDTDDEEEINSFGEWAFGPSFKDMIHTLQFMEAWNERHGKKFILSASGIVEYDLPKMIDLWKESQ